MQKNKRKLSQKEKEELIGILLNKYLIDKDGLQRALPELVQRLDIIFPRAREVENTPPPIRLTELELSTARTILEKVLNALDSGVVSKEQALIGLESWAVLVCGGSDFDYLYQQEEKLWQLIEKATGRDLRSRTKSYRKTFQDREAARPVKILRGLTFQLTQDMRLSGIILDAAELRKRQKALSFVGIAADSATDVAARHDDYLFEIYSHD